MILNNYKGKNNLIVNMLIIVLKQFIYAQKCFDVQPTFVDYISKLSYWYNVDKQIANDNNEYNKFVKKWKNLF